MDEYRLKKHFQTIAAVLEAQCRSLGMETPRGCLVRQVFAEGVYPPRGTTEILRELCEDVPKKLTPLSKLDSRDAGKWREQWCRAAGRWINIRSRGSEPIALKDLRDEVDRLTPTILRKMRGSLDAAMRVVEEEMARAPPAIYCGEWRCEIGDGRVSLLGDVVDVIELDRGVLANLVRRCPDPVAIYRVASRYTSLMVSGAANLHGQVPPELLEGFDGECFASPLNAHLPRFYSPFPEIDAPFGSLGSFFASPPKEGTWECNPPFSEELMCRMVDVLIGAKFLVVVPFWEDSAAIQKLMKHPHRVIKKHYYIAGVGGKRFSPPNPTLVAFVGGDQGFVDSFVKKWEANC